MIIIYYCYGSAHSSVFAASIHTGLISSNKIPSYDEIIKLPHYDRTPTRLIGTIYYIGKDSAGNKVYILGTGKAHKMVVNTLNSIMYIEGISKNKIILMNSLKYINIFVRFGGYLSRRLGIVSIGRRLTVYGLKIAYAKFAKGIEEFKNDLGIA
jgi:hypothetical protein